MSLIFFFFFFFVELSEQSPHNLLFVNTQVLTKLPTFPFKGDTAAILQVIVIPLLAWRMKISCPEIVRLIVAFLCFTLVCFPHWFRDASHFVFPTTLCKLRIVFIYFLSTEFTIGHLALSLGRMMRPTTSFIGFWENDADVSMSWVRPVEYSPLIHAQAPRLSCEDETEPSVCPAQLPEALNTQLEFFDKGLQLSWCVETHPNDELYRQYETWLKCVIL